MDEQTKLLRETVRLLTKIAVRLKCAADVKPKSAGSVASFNSITGDNDGNSIDVPSQLQRTSVRVGPMRRTRMVERPK